MKKSTSLQDALLSPYWRMNTVSTALGISRCTVYDWVKKGYLPEPLRMGNVLLWDKQQVLASLKDHGLTVKEVV